MEIFHGRSSFDFVGKAPFAYFLSGAMILASVVSLFVQGLNFGIDFAGGVAVQVRFHQAAPVGEIRTALGDIGMGSAVIQEFGAPEEVLIRVPAEADQGDGAQSKVAQSVMDAMKTIAGGGELRRVEYVGPQVGRELAQNGLMAVLYSCIAILAYVAWRFEFRFAVGSVVALIHDVLITVGFFSITQREFNLVVVAATLTIMGYSINDTIVVFDRIREEMKRMKQQPLATVINVAINETLSRTVITSWTVVVVLLALFLFGGEVIHDFSLALLLGVVVGTYSSIFVASPIILLGGDKGGAVVGGVAKP